MALLDQGWTEEQAQGLLDALKVSNSVPNWKPAYLQTLCDWCGQRRKNPKTIEGQLDSSPMRFATSMKISARHSNKQEPEERHD